MKAVCTVAIAMVSLTFVSAVPKCPEQVTDDTILLPNEQDCATYYICSGGIAFLMNCSKGLLFNSELLVCDWPHNVKCPDSSSSSVAPTQDPNEGPSSTESSQEPSNTESSQEPSSTESAQEPSSTDSAQEPSTAEPSKGPSNEISGKFSNGHCNKLSDEPSDESSDEPSDEPSNESSNESSDESSDESSEEISEA